MEARERKIVIGVVGESGAGKSTFFEILSDIVLAPPSFIGLIKSSDILEEILSILRQPASRENLQNLPCILAPYFGDGFLSSAVEERILNSNATIIIFDGIRWPSDVRMLRTFPHNFLVYITAISEIRYERLQYRGEKPEERNLSLEKFKKQELASTEVLIHQIGAAANYKIENNGTLDEFEKKVLVFKSNFLVKTIRELYYSGDSTLLTD